MRLLRISELKEESKRCGNCRFCSKYEISLYSADMAILKAAAKEILDAKPNGPLLPSEHIINLFVVFERLCKERVYCQKEKVHVRFFEDACSLWTPRLRQE